MAPDLALGLYLGYAVVQALFMSFLCLDDQRGIETVACFLLFFTVAPFITAMIVVDFILKKWRGG